MMQKNSLTKLVAPVSVNFEITDKCNLGCSFCFNASPEYSSQSTKQKVVPILEMDEDADVHISSALVRLQRMRVILDELSDAGVFEVRFFGGEFTVFKYWRELIGYAGEKGFFISFVSNGSLFSDEDISHLSRSGVTSCSISLHGTESIHDAVVGRKGSYSRAMDTIIRLRNAGIAVSVVYTPCAENSFQIYPFVRELKNHYGISDFGINRLFHDERYENLILEDYLQLLADIERCYLELGVNISLSDSFPRCVVSVRFWPYLSYCLQGVGFAQVDFNGRVKHCSATSVPLGNILEQNLRELWDRPLEGMRSLTHLPKSCRICPIFCGGGCSASRGVGEQFAPDEFIPWPGEETWFSAIRKAVYNRGRKFVFDVLIKPTFKKTEDVPQVLPEKPKIMLRYKMRLEADGQWLVMFEKRGLRMLSPLAAKILVLLDGTRTIGDIVRGCMDEGLPCTGMEVEEIAKALV